MANRRSGIEMNIYHTPERSPRPDYKNKSHLQATMPSIQNRNHETETRSINQFGSHYRKKSKYDFSPTDGHYHMYSEKRSNKNSHDLQQTIEGYEHQISLLKKYLQSSEGRCIEKESIGRILGMNKGEANREEQKVIKELGSKVKSLIKENNTMKCGCYDSHQHNRHSYHYSEHSHLNIEDIIQQNKKLQGLLENYRASDSHAHEKYLRENQLLKEEIYKVRAEYEQKIKLMQIEFEKNYQRSSFSEDQWSRKVSNLEKKHQELLESEITSLKRHYEKKIADIERDYKYRIECMETDFNKKQAEKDSYYLSAKREWEIASQNYQFKIKSEELKKLQEYYSKVIEDMERGNKAKFDQLIESVIDTNKKIDQTDKSIGHLKFERANRMQRTMRKSRNLAEHSPKPRGDHEDLEQEIQQRRTNSPYRVSQSRHVYQADPGLQSQISILNQKISYYEVELSQLKSSLSRSEILLTERNQRIIILQNQIRSLNENIVRIRHSYESRPKQYMVKEVIKEVPVVKELVKEVPVVREVVKEVSRGRDYSEQVNQIKESIISCNLSNFDVFQTEFNEIIEQRNQMDEKLKSLKIQSKESTKSLTLEKHLKVERERNYLLEQKLKSYESEIQRLKVQIINLQTDLENMSVAVQEYESTLKTAETHRHLPDGKEGLEWQKVIKHCLVTSIKRLENLESKMKRDMSRELVEYSNIRQ